MGRIRTILKWGFFAAVSLLVLVVAAWAVARAVYPTADQREAIAEMERQPEFAGRNAFPLLWTLERNVPDNELEAVMAEDVRRFSEISPAPDREDTGHWSFDSAAEDYPDLRPSDDDRVMFCRSRDEDCLSQVREDPEAYVALIDRNRALLDRIDRLRAYDHLQSEFPYRINAPFPAYQHVFLPRTRHTVEFVEGSTRDAMAATCREIATWRRLGASSDTLIARLIGVAAATDQYGYSLANMLAEQPVDTPLPEACDEALAPPAIDEVSLCNAMRGEFSAMAASMRDLPQVLGRGGYFDRWTSPLLYDAEATLGEAAEHYQSLCASPERERLRADRREVPEPERRGVWHLACMGNPAGCMMNALALSSYGNYRHRLQDYGAKLRVLGTLAWMRRHAGDGRTSSRLLAARPDELKSPARDIELGPDGRTLRVPLYDTARGEHWSIPLPPTLHSAPETSG